MKELDDVATQRLTVATLAGQAAAAVAVRFEDWRTTADLAAVDQLCAAVRKHALSLPVVYFAEWVDRWLMGDLVPGPNAVAGQRFEATCMTPDRALAWANRCGTQFAEQKWLASRLQEATAGRGDVAEQYAVVVIREIVGTSTSDDEVRAALDSVPEWLSSKDFTPLKWDASLAERVALRVDRVGFRQGELRVFLRPVSLAGPRYVLQLEEVASFYDSLSRGDEVRISDWPRHGSFGWWLPADDPHHSVKLVSVGPGGGFLLALARRVVYRVADESEALNWPG